jgi:selenocysteine lyase/cysteine desulfurase
LAGELRAKKNRAMSLTKSRPGRASLKLVGDQLEIPLVDGSRRPYVNLDYAASAPPLVAVTEAVQALMPYYSSVHRGAGFKSQVSTLLYEGARLALRDFFGARADDSVVFTRNTTDSINLLAASLPPGTEVVTFATEHHANLLPWQRGALEVSYLPPPTSAQDALELLAAHLKSRRADLVAVTGASNVTGELWPVAELAQLAHDRGARILIDAAQLAPHCPIGIAKWNVDYLAASGHKLYAPYGAGVLVGRPDWLERADPYMRGGGAVDFVTTTEVQWTGLPDRQEAGSPNVVGAAAMGAAVQVLSSYGMAEIADDELELADYLRQRMQQIEGIETYRLWEPSAARIGVVPFNVRGYEHNLVASILSAEHGIGVRHGCFCAHPLMLHLLQVDAGEASRIRDSFRHAQHPTVPGAVRASLGIGTTREQVDYFLGAVAVLAGEGPRWQYRHDATTGEYYPDPDPRPWPELGMRMASIHRVSGAESS